MSSPTGGLRDYARAKQSVADLLQQLYAAMKTSGEDQDDAESCRVLLGRLAEDRFNLAVVGQFNRGKSTLLNALLGRPVLPTGMVPVTSVLTSITYGTRERLIIRRKGRQFPEIAPLESIGRYVTESGNPGNREQIEEAVVETALSLARHGVSFVDTPGIASAREANSATTYGFLPQVDAVIFVTSVESPMSAPEVDLLREALGFSRELFVVINKIDLAEGSSAREREDIHSWVSEQVRRITGSDARVYEVSSLRALEARAASDEQLYSRSGLGVLVDDIERFLAGRRQETFLLSVLSKAIRLAFQANMRARLAARIVEMRSAAAPHALEALASRFDNAEREVESALEDLRSVLVPYAVSAVREDLTAMRSVWHSFLAGVIGNLQRELESSPTAPGSPAAWQDGLLAELAKEQTAWMSSKLQELKPLLVARARSSLSRIDAALASLDRVAAGKRSPADDSGTDETEHSDLPEITVLPVSPATVNAWTLPAIGLVPRGMRQRLVRKALAQRIDSIVEASQDPVVSSCRGSLTLLLDTLARDYRRQLRRRRRAFLETEERSAVRPSFSADLVADILGKLERLKNTLSGSMPRNEGAVRGDPEPLLAWTSLSRTSSRTSRSDAQSRCLICLSHTDAEFALFSEWQYLLSRDGRFRDSFARERGFCPLHTWQFEQIASPQTISFGFAPVLESAAAAVERAAGLAPAKAEESLAAVVPENATCATCAFLRTEEDRALRRLLDELSTEEGRRSFESSFGLCIPHFRRALRLTEDGPSRAILFRHQARKLEETVDNMRSYSVKRESLRRHLVRDDEDDAWHSALRRLVGERNISVSRQLT